MKKLTIITVLIVCVLFAHIHAVYASTGYASIETIKAGDKVLAANPETGEQDIKTVVQTFVNETEELVHVTVNGETITTTPEHPFYVPQKGWTGAIHLRAGDMLVLSNGEYVVVEKVEHELLESPVKVYNFEVEDFHTYYVSEFGVLVHNKCFRDKLKEKMSLSDNDIVDMDAHHVFPQKFRKQFKKLDIDIDDPQFGVFLDKYEHRSFSKSYNADWSGFFKGKNISKTDALDFGRILSNKYGYNVHF